MAGVRFENVTKRYGKVLAVNGFSLDIADKEFLVLVGPSGSGKSTALRLLAGLEEINEGDIYIGDRLINNVPAKDRGIAMVFQSYALYPHMTVYKNMAFGLSLRKTPKEEIKTRVEKAADILGITELLQRKPRQLSGGQRQRVALGRAIVRKPVVFLLDEPLSNLDAKLRVQTRAELSKLHQRLGTTFVYVTHDQVEAMTMATRIAVMDRGVIQQVGEPQELYNRPDNAFVAGFIGSPAMNFFPAGVAGSQKDMQLDTGAFRLPVPKEKLAALKPYLGKKITFGIRPEHIHDPKYMLPGMVAPVKAKVEVTELMGNEFFLHLVAGDKPFLARVDSRTSARPGQDIEVVFGMDEMQAFDPETGQAISANKGADTT
jgi:multiple sugar transport system ATP-binding protein